MSMFNLIKYLLLPPKFRFIYAKFHNRKFSLLDVGCGYNAPSKTLSHFPNCVYYGLDKETTELNENDLLSMKQFYKVDLAAGDLSAVPDDTFDVILVSHVIEHIRNGVDILVELTSKLRKGGLIYIEYPGVRSLNMPHAKAGFLHFCDDPDHVRVYELHQIANALLDAQLHILSAGRRRDPVRILLSPLLLLRGALRGDLWSGGIWDLAGICEFALARKSLPPQISSVSCASAEEQIIADSKLASATAKISTHSASVKP